MYKNLDQYGNTAGVKFDLDELVDVFKTRGTHLSI